MTASMNDDLIKKIRALGERTVENGCTEAEAMLAAQKMSDLMEKHNIKLSDVHVREADCSGIDVSTGTTRMPMWLSDLASVCAWHFDAKCIYNGRTVTFFGFPEDAEAAKALFHVLWDAVKHEAAMYIISGDYIVRRHYNSSRVLTNSFRIGMVSRLMQRLDDIKKQRDANIERKTGTSLVIIKESKVDEDLAAAFPKLRKAKHNEPELDRDALKKGASAANSISLGDQIANA